jgi:uncharacterized protein
MTTAVTRLFLLVSMFFMSMGLQAATERESITLWSEGVRLAGDLVKPAGLASADKLPGILMVPGWGGSKANLLRGYAPQFADQGYVVMVFDYKGWGESNGPLLLTESLPAGEISEKLTVEVTHVRQVVDPLSKLEDIRAALNYLAGDANVDADNIGIWGTSLGGGLALVTAAGEPRIKALVSQIGAVDSRTNYAELPDAMVQDWEIQLARGEIGPYPGPEWGTPGLRGVPDLVRMKRYDPAAVWSDISVPTLVIDAESEELFDRMKNGAALHASLKGRVPTEYLVLPGKHYDVYRDEGYRRGSAAAQAWFKKYLTGD